MEGRDKTQLITVVIPNYNGMDYLRECLDSVSAGTFRPAVIVVDNHSGDGSRELIEREYPRVTLLSLHANTGFCHAVNAGLHLVKTRYAILLNNDTRVDPHAVEELYNAIAQNERAFSAQAKMLSLRDPDAIDDAGDLYCALGWAFARGKAKTADHYAREGEIFSACAGAAIYRMKVFDTIGWFDERHYCYLEDVDIGYRAKIYGYSNLYAPKAIVYHAGSATSGSVHNPFKEEMTSGNNAYLLYKNMPAFQYVLNAPLIHLGIAVKRRYFHKKGLGTAYESGLVRGQYLIQEAKNMDWLKKYDFPYKKRSIPEEACIENEEEEELTHVLPLYLGGKVPFAFRHLPNYLKIQGELWANLFRRLT
jgi:GT2 family glycosyltransferase